ncbi:unnamed protein product [Tetraodon nigroviridis]|uniref:(spotted green pufferfish) hypothetical protein n=1 Tax=Tetraodon nigroviridis TaxID=99883 RepID=Q4TG74_TETNG|nr:unnamed protein product [Tetraodon nigroviridis]
MLCAALYPNVVQVGFHPEKRNRRCFSSETGLTLALSVSGPSSSGEFQDDEQRSHEDAPQSKRAPLRHQKRRLRPRAPLFCQLHGEKRHRGPAGKRGAEPTGPVTSVRASGSPLRQPVSGVPREGEDEPRLHQGLQHGVGVPAGAVRGRAGQHGAPQGSVCHLSGRRLDPVRRCFSPGGRAGEDAAMGAGPAAGGQDQEPQHGPLRLPARLPHHPHDRPPHLHPIAPFNPVASGGSDKTTPQQLSV